MSRTTAGSENLECPNLKCFTEKRQRLGHSAALPTVAKDVQLTKRRLEKITVRKKKKKEAGFNLLHPASLSNRT